MKKILVPMHFEYSKAVEGLGDLTDDIMDFMENPENYKLVLFTGGEDVTPEFYGETSPMGMCHNNRQRDEVEAAIFMKALKNGIKMTGICRGTQFINVMSGGRMIHHLDGHTGAAHEVQTSKDEIFVTNSAHHQMIVPPEDGLIIGWCKERRSKDYIGDGDKKVVWTGPEVEMVLIPRTQCCGVQWHPEWMKRDTMGYMYYHQLVRRFLETDIEDFTKDYTKKRETGA